MATQHIDTEWHEMQERERDAIRARLFAEVAKAAFPVPVRRPLRERLARTCRISPRVAPHFGRDGH
jgi:hypothetical protein